MLGVAWAVVSVFCYGDGRPPQLPAGWIFVQEEGIDTAAGAYHDQQSGMLVRTETDHVGDVLAPWADSAARKRGLTTSQRSIGEVHVTHVSWPDESKGCEKQLFSMACVKDPKGSWNLSATTCGQRDRARLDELVGNLAMSDWPRVGPPPRLVNIADLKSLSIGDDWARVQKVLGNGDRVDRGKDGGFIVAYEAAGGLLRLQFSQQQKLIDKPDR